MSALKTRPRELLALRWLWRVGVVATLGILGGWAWRTHHEAAELRNRVEQLERDSQVRAAEETGFVLYTDLLKPTGTNGFRVNFTTRFACAPIVTYTKVESESLDHGVDQTIHLRRQDEAKFGRDPERLSDTRWAGEHARLLAETRLYHLGLHEVRNVTREGFDVGRNPGSVWTDAVIHWRAQGVVILDSPKQ
jgi:hypothetical protein